MPLVINDQLLDHNPEDTRSFFDRFPHFKDMNGSLLSQKKMVGPQGLLYVHQRELAVTTVSDKHITYLGTDSLTTCQCVIIRNTGSGAIGLGHFDGAGVESGINMMVRKVQEYSPDQYHYGVDSKQNRFEVHIIGGFVDKFNISENVAMQILYSLRKQVQVLHLVQACFCELNTDYTLCGDTQQSWPIVMGVGVNVKTGQIFPATFHDRGPEIPLRSTVFYSLKEDSKHVMYDIYNSQLGQLRIGPYHYQPLRAVDMWLQEDDASILQKLSTSPEVEPPHFVSDVRATFKFIKQNPFPAVTVFHDNKPKLYHKDENGAWVQHYPQPMLQHLY